MASVRNAVRLIDIIIANYYKSHNNQQKLAVIVYHNATLRALTRHFRGFFHWTPKEIKQIYMVQGSDSTVIKIDMASMPCSLLLKNNKSISGDTWLITDIGCDEYF
uniref:hypothetical protein n=1 Tax=Photorhabdus sp. RM322S TaxID=3342825 RepID=UPI0036DEAB61